MSKKRRCKQIHNKFDRHHICFQKRYWNKGYAKAICQAFVRLVPVIYHRELHQLIHNVPLPPATMLHEAWNEYQRNKDIIDTYDITRAISWLYVHVPDPAFRKAMQIQLDFFVTRLNRHV